MTRQSAGLDGSNEGCATAHKRRALRVEDAVLPPKHNNSPMSGKSMEHFPETTKEMHAQHAGRQSRIPEQQAVGQTLPPIPVGIDTHHATPLTPGAMANGTRLQVGKYRAIIHNFIAEGGFAHVYLAQIEGKKGFVVLKRVAVPDTERLQTVEKEIAFMRRLGDHKHIVRYFESRISPLPAGGFEALILMEYCPGGGVIDLMNRRLQHRLTEPEILKIFNDVCEALAYMHYCSPPVLHRDLKVENILILGQDHYKLCDFGSAALSQGSYVPKTLQEVQKVEDDIQRHTTLQYRAPEMIDIYQKKPINEKADIWALGVLLYKLCYYTTPFEEQGQLAILNAKYTFPADSNFSHGMRRLIQDMLQEDQQRRPNIYQVMKAVSDARGVPCPIRDIYQSSTPPTVSTNSRESPPIIFEKVTKSSQQMPVVTPMRRGRPQREGKVADAFASLDEQSSPPSHQSTSMAFDSDFVPTKVKSHQGSQQSSPQVPSMPTPVDDSPKLRSSVSSSIEARFQAIKNSGLGATSSSDRQADARKSSSPAEGSSPINSASPAKKHSPLNSPPAKSISPEPAEATRNQTKEPEYWSLETHVLDPISIPPVVPGTTDKSENPEPIHKPAPPPKPARFRIRSNAAPPRKNSVSEFEKLFPSVEELRNHLPNGDTARN